MHGLQEQNGNYAFWQPKESVLAGEPTQLIEYNHGKEGQEFPSLFLCIISDSTSESCTKTFYIYHAAHLSHESNIFSARYYVIFKNQIK